MSTLIVSATATATATPPEVDGWTFIATSVIAPGTPPVGVLAAVTDFQFAQAEFAGTHYGLGRSLPVVITDVLGGNDGQATVETFEDTTFTILAGLLRSQATMWMAGPFGQGWYVRAGFQGGASANPSSPSTSPAAILSGGFDPNTGAARVRTLTIAFIEQAQP